MPEKVWIVLNECNNGVTDIDSVFGGPDALTLADKRLDHIYTESLRMSKDFGYKISFNNPQLEVRCHSCRNVYRLVCCELQTGPNTIGLFPE